MRRFAELPPVFTPLERVRVLLVFQAAGVGTVLDFDQDLMPGLTGMQPHTLMYVITRLMSEVCVLPANGAAHPGKPSRFSLSPHGVEVAKREIQELVSESEIARRLLVRMGHAVPEPVVAAADDAAAGAGVADLVPRLPRPSRR